MRVTSNSGLPVSSIVWQSSTGAFAFTAVCKLTFRLDPGVASLADQQEAVAEEDNYWNDDESRSLVAPSDLAPFKPRADVVLVGSAFAPDRRPARSLVARLCVGEVDKSIEVRSDRWFEPDGGVREGPLFAKMALRYERASGGHDLWNPVGVPFDGHVDAYGRRPIANLQPLGTFVQWSGDRFDAIGFGPLAPTWPGRMEKLHRHAGRWSHRDWQARPLPADMDLTYFNVAPEDQQTEVIHSNERILLENLHRDHVRLVTSLPGFAPRADVERASGHRESMVLVADTLWIDTDRTICTVTWRGRIGLVEPREEGEVRIRVEGLDLRRPGGPVDATVTLAGGLESATSPALPFEASPWRVSPLATSGADRPHPIAPYDAGATVLMAPGGGGALDTLPFATSLVPAPEPPVPPAVMEERQHARPPLGDPFTTPSPPVQPVVVRPLSPVLSSSPSPSWSSGPVDEADRTENAPLVPLGSGPGSPPWEALGMRQDPLPVAPEARDLLKGLTPPQESSLKEQSSEGLAPPPMIGPLARPEPTTGPVEPVKPMEAEKAPAVAPKPQARPEEPPLDPEKYTVERCARIAVALACRPADAAKILEKHELSEKGWERVKNHWVEAIRKELAKGKPGLRNRYDVAYVEQVEAERGPIGVPEYARLAVASERGTVGEVVAEMGLPAGAPMRIERVWMERMARDVAFAAKVREAVEEGRTA